MCIAALHGRCLAVSLQMTKACPFDPTNLLKHVLLRAPRVEASFARSRRILSARERAKPDDVRLSMARNERSDHSVAIQARI